MVITQKTKKGFTPTPIVAWLSSRASQCATRFRQGRDVARIDTSCILPAQQCHDRCRGFTLIELIVVMGILVIVSTLMFTNNSRFGGTVFLENLAYDVALSFRKAQVYGIAVRRYGSNDFNVGYGMHFSLSDPTRYELFADGITENGVFDCQTSDNCEELETSEMQSGYRVSKLCVPAGSNEEDCSSVPRVDVLFKRPEPDACIGADGAATLDASGMCVNGQESARIVLESPRGDTKSVIVEITGQIAVE